MNDRTHRVGLLDSLFLYGETHSTMMHVAALMPFSPPAGADRLYVRDLVADIRRTAVVQPPWNRKLRHPPLLTTPLQSWVEDPDFDLDYHVRRSAVPSPGDDRELAALVSRLHSHEIDFSRPPWEVHFIEGLEGGRFAVYVKIHHALMDGYTGMQILERSLSTDPEALDTPMFFHLDEAPRPRQPARGGLLDEVLSVFRTLGGEAATALSVSRALLNLEIRRGGERRDLVRPLTAPDTLLNRRIGRSRRFAGQQYSLPLLKKIGLQRDATVNDVALSVIGGGLRRFLLELHDLPEKPLVAFVPVNIRPDGDGGGGNAVGAILASLGTDHADPVERLDAVAASTRSAKSQLTGMSQEARLAYAVSLLAPALAQIGVAVAGLKPRVPLDFNVTVSNVAGPREPRYFRGSRLEGAFPLSIPVHGVALNITLEGCADTLSFGFVGDRDVVPEIERLAAYTGDALRELQVALAVDV